MIIVVEMPVGHGVLGAVDLCESAHAVFDPGEGGVRRMGLHRVIRGPS